MLTEGPVEKRVPRPRIWGPENRKNGQNGGPKNPDFLHTVFGSMSLEPTAFLHVPRIS